MHPSASHAVVIDVETSGVNPFRHALLSVGLAPLDPAIGHKAIYIRPSDIEWSDHARRLFENYAAEWQAHAVSPQEACRQIEDYLARSFPGKSVTAIGHNIGFDMAFLRQLAFLGGRDQLAGLSHRSVDTHTLLYVLVQQGRLPDDVLSSDGAFQHFNIDIPAAARHTALGDAIATRELVLKLFELLRVTGDGGAQARQEFVRG